MMEVHDGRMEIYKAIRHLLLGRDAKWVKEIAMEDLRTSLAMDDFLLL